MTIFNSVTITLCNDPRFSDRLTNIFNKNCPKPKILFYMECKKIFLFTQWFETNITLKNLIVKLAMLLALNRARTASDNASTTLDTS